MTLKILDEPSQTLIHNIKQLFKCLSTKRKIQIFALFLLQSVNACLEIVSIGAVVPFLSALTNIEQLMNNQYIITLMEWTGIVEEQSLVVLMAVLFSASIILANVSRLATLWAQEYLAAGISIDIGKELFQKMLYKPYRYFQDHNSSQLIGSMTHDLNCTVGTINNFFKIITQVLIASFIAFSLLVYDTQVALILSLVTFLSYAIITFFMNKRLRRNGETLSNSYQKMIKTLQDGFGGVRYIIMDRTQDIFVEKYASFDTPFRTKKAENSLIRQAPRFIMESIGVLAISGLILILVAESQDISAIIPLLGFLVLGCYRLLPAVQQIYAGLSALLGLTVPLERVISVLSAPFDPVLVQAVDTPLALQKDIQFKNVWFDYDEDLLEKSEDLWTLKDINFSMKAKTSLALVGQTGSGKSTLSDLVLGLMQPQKGEILIDDIPLNAQNIGGWHKAIAHVPQNIFLTDSSIAQNIAFGVPYDEIDMAQIEKAATAAQIKDFIETLPAGYETMIGEQGVRLSGGQRQRIGIARALYKKPSVIIFDEATSSLDNKTEQDIMLSINHLRSEATIIIIAHRLSTIQDADNILFLENGHIRAQGSYMDLVKKCKPFKALVELSKAA